MHLFGACDRTLRWLPIHSSLLSSLSYRKLPYVPLIWGSTPRWSWKGRDRCTTNYFYMIIMRSIRIYTHVPDPAFFFLEARWRSYLGLLPPINKSKNNAVSMDIAACKKGGTCLLRSARDCPTKRGPPKMFKKNFFLKKKHVWFFLKSIARRIRLPKDYFLLGLVQNE